MLLEKSDIYGFLDNSDLVKKNSSNYRNKSKTEGIKRQNSDNSRL